AKETSPRLVFERLFAVGGAKSNAAAFKQAAYKRSLLDFVADDARDLKRQLGGSDKRKLDEYLTGVREIEQRLARVEKDTDFKGVPGGYKAPSGFPRNMKD